MMLILRNREKRSLASQARLLACISTAHPSPMDGFPWNSIFWGAKHRLRTQKYHK